MASSSAAIDYTEVKKGVHLIWNNKFDEADQFFGEHRLTNPRYALHYAESRFMRSFITADVDDTKTAMERLSESRSLAEKHMSALEKGMVPAQGQEQAQKFTDAAILAANLMDARICYGDTLYMTAILQMTRDAKIKGAFNLRRSWKIFEKALKQSKEMKTVDPELMTCLKFGAGLFLFALSIIPPKYLRLVEMAGFKADKEAGLHYVKECHNANGIREPFATMVLLFNNLLLPRGVADVAAYVAEADMLIKKSLERYPTGSLFHVMGSHCARKQNDIDGGIKLMEVAIENSSHFKQPPLIYRYELANCWCMKMEWSKAADLYLPLTGATTFQVRALCGLQLAGTYMMMGETKKAMDVYGKIPGYINSKSNIDPMVVRQAKRYQSNGGNFAAFELLFIRRDMAKMVPIMEDVIKTLDGCAMKTKAMEQREITAEMRKNTNSKLGKLGTSFKNLSPFSKKNKETDNYFDDRASYLLLKGAMLKAINRMDESSECFREVCDDLADFIQEKFYVPYCLYEWAENMYSTGRNKEALTTFKRCSKISGYDWEDPLRIRLRVTMDQLKKGDPNNTETKAPISLDQLISQGGDKDDEVEPGSDDEEQLGKMEANLKDEDDE